MYLHGFILFFSSPGAARYFICYKIAFGNSMDTFLSVRNLKKLKVFEELKHHLVFS